MNRYLFFPISQKQETEVFDQGTVLDGEDGLQYKSVTIRSMLLVTFAGLWWQQQ